MEEARSTPDCVVLYCIILCCIILYCVVLCCIVLYCIISYRIVLYCVACDSLYKNLYDCLNNRVIDLSRLSDKMTD